MSAHTLSYSKDSFGNIGENSREIYACRFREPSIIQLLTPKVELMLGYLLGDSFAFMSIRLPIKIYQEQTFETSFKNCGILVCGLLYMRTPLSGDFHYRI